MAGKIYPMCLDFTTETPTIPINKEIKKRLVSKAKSYDLKVVSQAEEKKDDLRVLET